MAGVAERLYYNSAELDFAAKVTDIRLEKQEGAEQVWQVALDRTAFYPEGGGQPWDTGVLTAVARSGARLDVAVERVEEDAAGEVWHSVRKPLVEGTEVTGCVDAARRMDHAQQHSGQHLLSAVFLREVGARTVSFHLGAEVSSIDLVLREGTERLADEELLRVEEAANRLIYEDRAMTPRWVARDEALAMQKRGELRKVPERDGPMRIVKMEGVEFNACGGTHVGSTGAIGGLVLRGLEKAKQGWRVEFCCGMRAVRVARRDYAVLKGVAGCLSVGVEEVPARVAALVEGAKRSQKERQKLLTELADAEAFALNSQFVEGALVEAQYSDRDQAFARRVGHGLRAKGRGAVLAVKSDQEATVVLVRPPDCDFHSGELIKAFLQDVMPGRQLRGGGGPDMAQIVVDDRYVASVREGLVRAVRALRPPPLDR